MKIHNINWVEDIQQEEDTVLVLGYFDGLHKGHRQLFDRAREIADREGLKVAVLTFPESPQLAFQRYRPELMLHLLSPKDRWEKFKEAGVDELYLIDFTTKFARLTAQEFLDEFITRLKARKIVVGFDYHFGCERQTAADLQALFGGKVEVVSSVNLSDEKISSTRIRQAVTAGDVALANQFLGYEFFSLGVVVHGDARGRTIGFPTANLSPLERVYLPGPGVYVVNVERQGKLYRGMASLGENVTFDGTEFRFEVNVFDFSEDIYGETIKVFWLEKLRDMVKFSGIDELCAQLEDDESKARNWTK